MSNELNENALNELQKQNQDFTDAYWDIFNNKEAVPADQQARMRDELLKNYERTVALLDGQAGIEKDQRIAKLELEHLRIREEERLREAELKEEYRLKHVELKAQADTKANRIMKEYEIITKAETATLEIKAEQIVPVKEELPKRWWQRLFRRPARYYTNYAYELASQKANLEAEQYLTAREDEVIKLEAEQSATDELKIAIEKVILDYAGGLKCGRKAKVINKALSELVEPLCGVLARREYALQELNKRLEESENKAFDEPTEQKQSNADIITCERGREVLQVRAATILAAFCQKRIDDLQYEQLNIKPKRQRKRKTRIENSEGNNND